MLNLIKITYNCSTLNIVLYSRNLVFICIDIIWVKGLNQFPWKTMRVYTVFNFSASLQCILLICVMYLNLTYNIHVRIRYI